MAKLQDLIIRTVLNQLVLIVRIHSIGIQMPNYVKLVVQVVKHVQQKIIVQHVHLVTQKMLVQKIVMLVLQTVNNVILL